MWSHLFSQESPLHVHKSLPTPHKCVTGSLLEFLPHTSAIKEEGLGTKGLTESLLSGGKTDVFSPLPMVAGLGIFWPCDDVKTEHSRLYFDL